MTQSLDIGGHRVFANCNAEHDAMARALLAKLAQLHQAGPPLQPGSKIDFGWSMLQIEAHPDHWVVCEPDYESDPLDWKPQVDDTLWVMQQQATLHAALGHISGLRTRGDQWLLLQPSALTAADVFLHRSSPTDAQNSGWYIGVDSSADAELDQPAESVIAGALLLAKPEWLCTLSLPVGYLVHFNQDELADIMDDRQACIYPPT